MPVGPINLSELKRIHERFKKRHEAIVKEALRTAGRNAIEHVSKHSKFKRRHRRSLKDNTKARVIRTRGGKILKLQWTKKHAPYIEYGTRKHPISVGEIGGGSGSTRGKSLKFFWKKGPRGPGVYYYRRVMHPGTRPYKFGWNSASAANRVLGRLLREGMDNAAYKF